MFLFSLSMNSNLLYKASDVLCVVKMPDLQSGIYCNPHKNVRYTFAGFCETSIVCYIRVTSCPQLVCPWRSSCKILWNVTLAVCIILYDNALFSKDNFSCLVYVVYTSSLSI